jgi:L-asparagine transporter-like permease
VHVTSPSFLFLPCPPFNIFILTFTCIIISHCRIRRLQRSQARATSRRLRCCSPLKKASSMTLLVQHIKFLGYSFQQPGDSSPLSVISVAQWILFLGAVSPCIRYCKLSYSTISIIAPATFCLENSGGEAPTFVFH